MRTSPRVATATWVAPYMQIAFAVICIGMP
jgi:hypothetical protein